MSPPPICKRARQLARVGPPAPRGHTQTVLERATGGREPSAIRKIEKTHLTTEHKLANIALHYGHWRSTLIVAKELRTNQIYSKERQLAIFSSSIILSRTAIEIYLNESWFSSFPFDVEKDNFSKYINLYIVDRYKRHAHLCGIDDTARFQALAHDLDLCNLIRNFCVHYPGPRLRDRLSQRLEEINGFSDFLNLAHESPQEYVINQYTAEFCYRTTLNAIMYLECHRNLRNAMTDDYIQFCKDMLK